MEFFGFVALLLMPLVFIWMWWAGAFHIIFRIVFTLLLAGAFFYLWDGGNGYKYMLGLDGSPETLVSLKTEKMLKEKHFTENDAQNDAIRAVVAVEEAFAEMGMLAQKLYAGETVGEKREWMDEFNYQLMRLEEALKVLEKTPIEDEEISGEREEWILEMNKHLLFLQGLCLMLENDDTAETEEAFVFALWLFYRDFGLSETE